MQRKCFRCSHIFRWLFLSLWVITPVLRHSLASWQMHQKRYKGVIGWFSDSLFVLWGFFFHRVEIKSPLSLCHGTLKAYRPEFLRFVYLSSHFFLICWLALGDIKRNSGQTARGHLIFNKCAAWQKGIMRSQAIKLGPQQRQIAEMQRPAPISHKRVVSGSHCSGIIISSAQASAHASLGIINYGQGPSDRIIFCLHAVP